MHVFFGGTINGRTYNVSLQSGEVYIHGTWGHTNLKLRVLRGRKKLVDNYMRSSMRPYPN
jgi:hypothetical protein